MSPLPGTLTVSKITGRLADVPVLARAGLLRPAWPDALMRGVLAVFRHGISAAAAYEYNAARFGSELAIVDDRGSLTFSELAARISALAASLERSGVGDDDRVGVLCRNHRELVETVAALSSLGADIVLLNVSFAAPQLARVLTDERVTALVYDEEFAHQAGTAAASMTRFVAWNTQAVPADPAIGVLDRGSGRGFPRVRRSPSHYLLLTSGTTGRPKGVARSVPLSSDPLVAMLSRIPVRARDVTLIAPPLFHAWGFGQLSLAMVLSSTVVLRSRFDPESTLRSIAEHRVRVLVAVPFMLQRLLDLPAETRGSYDLSSLEVVITSGSQLPGALASKFMDAYGEILYNVYGSTEAAWGAIATPADLRAAPGTAGFPPRGSEVRIAGDEAHDVERGQIGRILVRNKLLASMDSTGKAPRLLGGYLPTGDLGHMDELGRLFVDGRDDEMIISGGENVYPQEVEELLAWHPAIAEAAVVGVPDPEYGQRLQALVVLREGVELSSAEVRAYVRERLARYKVPRDVRFVDALPRNETGKVIHVRPGEGGVLGLR